MKKIEKQIKKDKQLAEIKIEGQTYSIRATIHALERMEQREVDEYVVAGNVLALGKERILKLQEEQEEAIIIDKDKDVSIVIGFVRNTIKVITVVDTENIWNKRNTHIERI